MKILTYIPIISVAIGEFFILYGNILAGIGIHIISLVATILIIIFCNLSLRAKNILQSLMLIPLLRIVSLSVPQLFNDVDVRYLLVFGIMTIPIYSIVKNQQILFTKLETNFERLHIYIFVTVLIWIGIVLAEQYMNAISNIWTYSKEDISVGGEFLSIFMIVILPISSLVSDTKYWNEYISNSIDICSSPLLLTFVTIVIHKIMVMM